ncbi:MAG: ABC transporter permease [Bifidobacterium choerinum]
MRTLALHQWNRARGAFLGFGAVILIAACMLGSALTLLFTVPARYDALADELAVADVDTVIPDALADAAMRDLIAGVAGVASLEEQPVLLTDTTISDFRGTDFTIRTMVADDDAPRTLSRTREAARASAGDGGADDTIAVPQFVAEFGGFAPGDTISMRMDGVDGAFRVAAVDEEMEFGNAGSGILSFGAPHDVFARLAGRLPDARMTQYALRLEAGADPSRVRSAVERTLADHDVPLAVAVDRGAVRATRTMVSRLIVLVLVVFAVLVAVVSLALCTFHIRNIVEQERVDMGVLKALGYTGAMISRAMMAPYVAVCVIASLLGLAVSLPLTSLLGSLVSMQDGFTFRAGGGLRAAALTVVTLVSVTLLFAWIGVRSVRALQPIDAIRGDGGHDGRAMRPLLRTPGDAGTAVALQQAGASPARNMLVGLVAALMTLLITFCATLVCNCAVRPANLYDTLSGETPQVAVTTVASPDGGRTAETRRAIEATDGVEHVVAYTTARVAVDGTRMPAYVSDDFAATSNDIRYEGEHPRGDGQIAPGTALADAHPIGSDVTVTLGGRSRSYRVVGLIRSVNEGGAAVELTEGGYGRLDPDFADAPHTLYVYCDGAQAAQVAERIEERCADPGVHVSDMERMRTTSQDMYATLTASVSLAVFVVALVLMMVVRSLIVRERRRFGVLKTLGYTSGQLICQTAAALLPATAAGALAGMALALATMRGATDMMLSVVGVMRSRFETPALLPVGASVVLTVLLFALARAFARPIRKVSPYELITR